MVLIAVAFIYFVAKGLMQLGNMLRPFFESDVAVPVLLLISFYVSVRAFAWIETKLIAMAIDTYTKNKHDENQRDPLKAYEKSLGK